MNYWLTRKGKVKRTLPIIDHILAEVEADVTAGKISPDHFWPQVLTYWLLKHGLTSRQFAAELGKSKRTIDSWRAVGGHRPHDLHVILAGWELAKNGAAECSECKAKRERFKRAFRRWRKKTPQEREKILNKIRDREASS